MTGQKRPSSYWIIAALIIYILLSAWISFSFAEPKNAPASAKYVVFGAFNGLLFDQYKLTCGTGISCDLTGSAPNQTLTLNVTGSGSGADPALTYVTIANETADLPNSYQLAVSSPLGLSGATISLSNSGITPATYGDSTHVPQCTFNAKGLATSCIDIAITFPTDLSGEPYITKTASSNLSNEFAMGSLGTGLVKNTTTTGVPSIYAGTSCTNQFPRSLDASGAATCASVAIGSDVSGLGTGVATFLGTPSSANFLTAITDEVGNGAKVVTADSVSGNSGKVAQSSGTLTPGDCAKFDASGNIVDAGAVCGNGNSITISGATTGDAPPHPVLNRKFGYLLPSLATSTSFTAVGMDNMVASYAGGTGSFTADPQTNKMYLRLGTAASNGAVATLANGVGATRQGWRPKLSMNILTDALATRREWFYLAVSSTSSTSCSASQSSGNKVVGICFDTGRSSSIVWCCSGDGTTLTCEDSGATFSSSTEYTISVDYSSASNVVCKIGNTSYTKTTNLPTGTDNMRALLTMTTTANAEAAVSVSTVGLEQN